MRVIAGTAKGRPLIAPKGHKTRPIPSLIKGALFNIWQGCIEGAQFLDLFAGSGSMGIEALSRGAAEAIFVEKDRKTADIIRKNLATCKLTERARVIADDVFSQIKQLKCLETTFDIIYLDPPFTMDGIFQDVLSELADGMLLTPDGLIAIRTPNEEEMPDHIGSLVRYQERVYGISCVHFYEVQHPGTDVLSKN